MGNVLCVPRRVNADTEKLPPERRNGARNWICSRLFCRRSNAVAPLPVQDEDVEVSAGNSSSDEDAQMSLCVPLSICDDDTSSLTSSSPASSCLEKSIISIRISESALAVASTHLPSVTIPMTSSSTSCTPTNVVPAIPSSIVCTMPTIGFSSAHASKQTGTEPNSPAVYKPLPLPKVTTSVAPSDVLAKSTQRDTYITPKATEPTTSVTKPTPREPTTKVTENIGINSVKSVPLETISTSAEDASGKDTASELIKQTDKVTAAPEVRCAVHNGPNDKLPQFSDGPRSWETLQMPNIAASTMVSLQSVNQRLHDVISEEEPMLNQENRDKELRQDMFPDDKPMLNQEKRDKEPRQDTFPDEEPILNQEKRDKGLRQDMFLDNKPVLNQEKRDNEQRQDMFSNEESILNKEKRDKDLRQTNILECDNPHEDRYNVKHEETVELKKAEDLKAKTNDNVDEASKPVLIPAQTKKPKSMENLLRALSKLTNMSDDSQKSVLDKHRAKVARGYIELSKKHPDKMNGEVLQPETDKKTKDGKQDKEADRSKAIISSGKSHDIFNLNQAKRLAAGDVLLKETAQRANSPKTFYRPALQHNSNRHGQMSDRGVKKIQKKKLSDYKAPKQPHYTSAPMTLYRKPHVNKIPDVARAEAEEKITWKQTEAQNANGQQFWAKAPVFEPPVHSLGERLLEQFGSVDKMKKSWVIPQCRQIETLKLEHCVYPGLRVNPGMRWCYSMDTGNKQNGTISGQGLGISRSNNNIYRNQGPRKVKVSSPAMGGGLSRWSKYSDLSTLADNPDTFHSQ